MARIKIPFRGQTANKMQDGDCRTIVNLRPTKQGIYKPVAPRRELRKLTRRYDHMFVHKAGTYEHWIGIQSNKVYVNVEEQDERIFEAAEPINSVEQIGNVVVLVCNSMTSHLLWVDGRYLFLGELPELPMFSISINEVELALSVKEGDGINEEYKGPESWLARVKTTLYRTQELIVNGGADGTGTTHEARGQQLFDAHIMQYAYRLYDGSLTKYSPPVLIMPSTHISEIKRMIWRPTEALKAKTIGYRPTLTSDAWYNEEWKDIIKSVDIFISPSLQMSSIERMIDPDDSQLETIETRGKAILIKQDKEHNLKSIKECGTLYLLKSIPYENGTSNQSITLLQSKEDEDAIKNIQYSELLPVDTGSNHTLGAKTSYLYNNRLHLANIKTTFFTGHSPKSFAYTHQYNGSASLLRPIGGGTSIGRIWVKYIVTVTLKIDGEEYNISTTYTPPYDTNINITSLISYPDIRAKRIKITAVDEGGIMAMMCDVALVEHNYLNIAYYVEGDLKAIGERYAWEQNNTPNNVNVISYEPNKLKVSRINNPFNYPNKNTYQIGNDKILALASQAQKISEGSFGQYPLYIFTTTGIYSLQIGQGEVLYSNQVAPVSYETPISRIVAETPYGIVFISNRGLCSISGQQVQLISESIDQSYDYIKVHNNDIVEINWPDEEFEEYLSRVKSIIYNPYHDEVILIASESAYSYVYNIPKQSFWLSTEDINITVRNTFPELYVIGSNALKTMKESREKSVRIAIITHPIDFMTPDIKRMQRAILRGLLLQVNVGEINAPTPKKMLVGIYNSLDEVNFNLSRGVMLQQDGSYKDLDLGLMARTKSRHFLVAIAGTINESSKIDMAEFELVEEYNNDKMR